jgi:twitching motility protein PilT
MHTIDAAETIGRMVEFFPADKQQMIRSILAGVLRGVVSQRLLPRKGGGRIAAVEVMVTNERIADLIRDAQSEEIPYAIDEGSFYEMQTLSRALIDLVLAGMVEREIAAGVAPNKHDFMIALAQAEKARAARAVNPPQNDPTRPSMKDSRSKDDEAAPLRLAEAG